MSFVVAKLVSLRRPERETSTLLFFAHLVAWARVREIMDDRPGKSLATWTHTTSMRNTHTDEYERGVYSTSGSRPGPPISHMQRIATLSPIAEDQSRMGRGDEASP